ncbi:hypothetical protein K8352_11010 [Flavobacteriaceae bacterium F89]|uniref:Lipoprotein n=1 Tax=Cerina litoralis TaxID=2874477 RepID=A0AAE3JRF3_9FLAO|nr:hypothetical protein [Cerina litoralis]MCG2461278.1 hypothetical protein [Cerina litoralis]
MRYPNIIFLSFLVLLSLLGCKAQKPNLNYMNEIGYKVINEGYTGNNDTIYFKAFTSRQYDSTYIAEIDDLLVIDGVGRNYREIGYKKIDSINALSEISDTRKSNLIDSIGRIDLTPKVRDFLGKKDLNIMASMANRKMKWDQQSLNRLKVTKDKKSVKISFPLFNGDNTIALLFEEGQNVLTAKFFKKRVGDEKWKFYCSGTIWRAD